MLEAGTGAWIVKHQENRASQVEDVLLGRIHLQSVTAWEEHLSPVWCGRFPAPGGHMTTTYSVANCMNCIRRHHDHYGVRRSPR